MMPDTDQTHEQHHPGVETPQEASKLPGLTRVVERSRDATSGYEAQGAPTPTNYVRVLAVYGGAVTAATIATRLLRRPLPERLPPYDLAVLALATHRLSRLISRDPVTSPLRAPFTKFAGTSGPAELHEEARGEGVRHTIGELVTCPFCVSQWVATGFVGGLVFAPRATRLVASVFAATATSDFLHFARAEMVDRTS